VPGELGSVVREVSAERLMEHIAEFDRWEKHAGTAGELESLRYCERRMQEYGFATRVIQHPAFISLPGTASISFQDGEAAGPCITHSFSQPTSPEGVTAPLVYAGSGRSEDYAGLAVAGKIVLLEGIANPAAALEAGRRGAVGEVHISPHQHLHEMCISPVWGSPGDDQLDRLPRTVTVTVALETGQLLKTRLGSGPVELTLRAEVDTGWRTTPILEADLVRPDVGESGSDQLVLFTGHHDTWYRGVMDNGGANATMLEVSRLCAQRSGSWQRSLRVLFWSGHSQGRYSSSAWYADNHWDELERRAVVHVNVDSTGGRGNTVVSDTSASTELHGLAVEALSAQAGQPFSGRRMSRAGDQSFWGIGVPSIYGNMSEQPAGTGSANAMAAVFGGGNRLGHGTGWWWHNPADTADKIDPEILVRDTRIYLHTVWCLLTDQVLPLDYAAHASALRDNIADLTAAAGDGFDLQPLASAADKLAEACRELRAAIDSNRLAPAAANECLRRLSRCLVPIDYTIGDRFRHDPALSQPPLPALAGLRSLRSLEAGTPAFLFLHSRLIRERNRVAFAVREAAAAVGEALAGGSQVTP
jgi:hypothetical protein